MCLSEFNCFTDIWHTWAAPPIDFILVKSWFLCNFSRRTSARDRSKLEEIEQEINPKFPRSTRKNLIPRAVTRKRTTYRDLWPTYPRASYTRLLVSWRSHPGSCKDENTEKPAPLHRALVVGGKKERLVLTGILVALYQSRLIPLQQAQDSRLLWMHAADPWQAQARERALAQILVEPAFKASKLFFWNMRGIVGLGKYSGYILELDGKPCACIFDLPTCRLFVRDCRI